MRNAKNLSNGFAQLSNLSNLSNCPRRWTDGQMDRWTDRRTRSSGICFIPLSEFDVNPHFLLSPIAPILDSYLMKFMPKDEALCLSLAIGARYEVGATRDGRAVCWQRDVSGRLTNGEVLRLDPCNGDVLEASPVTDHLAKRWTCKYYVTETGFFGGGLVSTASTVYVVQEETDCILLAASLPKECAAVAVGHAHNLTASRLKSLEGRNVVLCPDGMAVEPWTELARGFRGRITVETLYH